MEEDDVRHHRCADDPYSEENAFTSCQLRHDGMDEHSPHGRTHEGHLHDVAHRDHADERGDDGFQGTKAEPLQAEDHDGGYGGQDDP